MVTWRVRFSSLVLVIGCGSAADPVSSQQSMFRSRSDAVAVNVTVTSNNAPVEGLSTPDFALFDNGVQQTIAVVTVESLAIDLTLALDISGSMRTALDVAKSAAQRIIRTQRPEDRVRVLTFAYYVQEAVPFSAPDPGAAVAAITETYGQTELYTALVQAMVSATDIRPDRRQLLVVLTDAQGEGVISHDTTAAVANRFDGVLHVVRFATGSSRTAAGLASRNIGQQRVQELAESTGGQLHIGASPDRIETTFGRILAEFRRSYVLRYTPEGSPVKGWHAIDVRVTRPSIKRPVIRARKGYFSGD